MKNQFFTGIACAALILASASCNKNGGYEKTSTGLEYKFFEQDEKGTKPKTDDIALIHMIAKSESDTELVNSYNMNDGKPLAIKIFPPAFAGSIEEAFVMMSKGDSASFLINADSFFTKLSRSPMPPFVKPGSKLKFNMRMVDVMSQKDYTKQEQLKEQAVIDQMKNQSPGKYVESGTGLMYEVVKANSSGRMPKNGDTVAVHYTGMLIDGKKFDSSVDRGVPYEVIIGQQRVIPGWEEMLTLMHEGEKVRAVIPSYLGYGPSGNMGIPPFATLIFEMEIVKIK
jgi:FKBP-type peptidyl-prolyl cis-trans isomerase FkpA